VNWAASGTVSEGVGGSVVGTGLLSVVGAVTGEFSGVVSGVIHPAVRIHEMAMNNKKKFILDVMNKSTLIPINRCPPWILPEKRIVMRHAGARYPCIAVRGFHPIMGLSAFLNENASGIFIFYACGPRRNHVIFIRGSSLLQMPALSPPCGGNQELPARERK